MLFRNDRTGAEFTACGSIVWGSVFEAHLMLSADAAVVLSSSALPNNALCLKNCLFIVFFPRFLISLTASVNMTEGQGLVWAAHGSVLSIFEIIVLLPEMDFPQYLEEWKLRRASGEFF